MNSFEQEAQRRRMGLVGIPIAGAEPVTKDGHLIDEAMDYANSRIESPHQPGNIEDYSANKARQQANEERRTGIRDLAHGGD